METNNENNVQNNTNAEKTQAISSETVSNIKVNDAEVVKEKTIEALQVNKLEVVPKDNNYYNCTIQCCIRRKPNMMSLPGQDPAEKIYRIGSALDSKTRRDLKGISGDLERMFMPSIVGLSSNDPKFGEAVSEYWSSIARVVPHDEPFLKDYEKGIKFNIIVRVLGKAKKERLDALGKVNEKIEWLNENLIKSQLTPIGEKTEERYFAILEHDSISDFLFLNYCLKYPKVANNFESVNNSPKIEFYIFEKELAVKTQLSLIDLRNKAIDCYRALESDEMRINSVLLSFNKNPKDFDTITDKLIELDDIYIKNPDSMRKFIKYCDDSNWKIKYLINKAVLEQKLRIPVNSSAIYYNDTLLGMNIEEASIFLTTDVKGKEIYEGLNREINLK